MRYRPSWICSGVSVCLVSLSLGLPLLGQQSSQNPLTIEDVIRDADASIALGASPEPIYSQDPYDPWNRIFYFLFSRRLQTRLSDDFPEGAPFRQAGEGDGPAGAGIRISTRMFERNEVGDRAIDPLYPSFEVGAGSRLVLSDLAYPGFAGAMRDALSEKVQRPVIARVLMQNDLWAAYDILSGETFLAEEKETGQHRNDALDLLGRLIRKVALTPDEIKSLPDNYSVAVKNQSFPDVFRKDSGWIEVQWFLPREHDFEVEFRRVSRVFLKPAHPPRDMQKFLNAQRLDQEREVEDLDGVALITQMLLIDTQGNVRPTALTTEAQVRRFGKTNGDADKKTSIQVCEINRRLFVREPESGGLVEEGENSPAYFGGYGFAEGQPLRADQSDVVGLPVRVRLRTRCARCHGENLEEVHTFAIAICTAHCPPGYRIPEVRQLNPSGRDMADFDIAEKKKRADFGSLSKYFR